MFSNWDDYKNGEITTSELITEAVIDGGVTAAFSAVGIDSSGKNLNASYKAAKTAKKCAKIVKTSSTKKAARYTSRRYIRSTLKYSVETLSTSSFSSFSVFSIQCAVKGKVGLRD